MFAGQRVCLLDTLDHEIREMLRDMFNEMGRQIHLFQWGVVCFLEVLCFSLLDR